eukprot:scaffold757_cov246-Pinguiococcus_pyrenoidosus.AAC.12
MPSSAASVGIAHALLTVRPRAFPFPTSMHNMSSDTELRGAMTCTCDSCTHQDKVDVCWVAGDAVAVSCSGSSR